MESTSNLPDTNHIAELVVEKLIARGALSKLDSASMDTIETEAVSVMDVITREVISTLLTIQSKQTGETQKCLKCGAECCSKPEQGRLLETKRGKVNFRTKVFRCEACRLDFFPSVCNARV